MTPTPNEHAIIEAARQDLCLLRTLGRSACWGFDVSLVVFDLEKYEFGEEILELLDALVDCGAGLVSLSHLIIEEHVHLSNGHYCPSDRNGFAYAGRRETVGLREALARFQRALDGARCADACAVVGHTLWLSDVRWLSSLGVDFTGLGVLDIADVDRAAIETYFDPYNQYTALRVVEQIARQNNLARKLILEKTNLDVLLVPEIEETP